MNLFCIIALSGITLSLSSSIELYISSKVPRIFHNVSFGLEYLNSYGHSCPKPDSPSMKYTPNRRLQESTLEDAQKSLIQTGFVIALGGHSAGGGTGIYNYGNYGAINGLMSVWDSWVDNYLTYASNSSSLIMLFDERDFHRHNFTSSKSEYLDRLLISNMGARPVDCVRLRRNHNLAADHVTTPDRVSKLKTHGCSNELLLDQGYQLYYIDPPTASDGSYRQPIIIIAGVYKFPAPEWASGLDEDKLYESWRPTGLRRAFQTNYGYVKLTNWYSYHMLELDVLDFFDYVGKLDSDVSFEQPFPDPNIPLRMIRKKARVMVTQKDWYHDAPQVCNGLRLCLQKFQEQEYNYCKQSTGLDLPIIPGGEQSHGLFWENNLNTTFRSHFTVLWLGIFASPEAYKLAKYWNDFHPHGMWYYRWGDQQYWPRPLSMFSDQHMNVDYDHFNEIDADAGTYMAHKPYPKFYTLKIVSYFNVNGSTKAERNMLYEEAKKKFK